MTKEFKEGENACYSGLAYNRNPYYRMGGIINDIKERAWNRGYKRAESQANGVDSGM